MIVIRPHNVLNLLLAVSISLIGCKGQSSSETEVVKLVEAIGEGDTTTIRALVKKGVNLHESFYPALNFYVAIELNDIYALNELVAKMDACGICAWAGRKFCGGFMRRFAMSSGGRCGGRFSI